MGSNLKNMSPLWSPLFVNSRFKCHLWYLVKRMRFYLCTLLSASALLSATAAPSCATNGTPCPAPHWTPEWSLTYSTIVQPSAPLFFIPPADQPWGLVSLDWSVANQIWSAQGKHNGTIERVSQLGCEVITIMSPRTKCFICEYYERCLWHGARGVAAHCG